MSIQTLQLISLLKAGSSSVVKVLHLNQKCSGEEAAHIVRTWFRITVHINLKIDLGHCLLKITPQKRYARKLMIEIGERWIPSCGDVKKILRAVYIVIIWIRCIKVSFAIIECPLCRRIGGISDLFIFIRDIAPYIVPMEYQKA